MNGTSGREAIDAQYRALRKMAALLEDDGRELLVGSGERPIAMLNGLVTNDLVPLDSKRAVFALALTPKGRPVAEMRVVPADGLWLDIPSACLEPLLAHLAKYVPPRLASFEHLPSVRRVSVVGPLAADAMDAAVEALGWARSAEGTVSPDPLGVTELAGGPDSPPAFVVRREPVEGPGCDLYVSEERVAAAREALSEAVRDRGGVTADPAAWQIWRVERGIPVFGVDFGPDNLPQESGLEGRAISYEKGCYTGQEVVARIHYRGHVNRLLRGLRLLPDAGGAALEPGARLYRDGRSVGSLTSAARSPRLGPIALGYVRREIEPGSRLDLEPGDPARGVEVHALPFTLS